ncbi:MAG: glycosyltransferase family protein [Candidatus Xenobia bacterium]
MSLPQGEWVIHHRQLEAWVVVPAYRVPQQTLQPFVDGWRDIARVALALDTLEGIDDLPALTVSVDRMLFSALRRGYGRARRALLASALADRAEWMLAVDSDGQHTPQGVKAMVEALPPVADFDVAIPQRTRVDLPLEGGGVNRAVAEKLQNYAIAVSTGNVTDRWRDFQPGLMLMRAEVARWALETVTTDNFDWDLEFCLHLMRSKYRRIFPVVETEPQTATTYGVEDARRTVKLLERLLGASVLRTIYDDFARETDLPPAEVERYRGFLEDSLV